MEKKILLKENSVIESEITAITDEGTGISRVDGAVMFTDFTVPGDTVKSRIAKVGKSCIYAELEEIVKPSPDRIAADCPVFGSCGGCALRHMSYEAELRWKRRWVKDHIERIGGFSLEPEETAASPEVFGYRNKAIYRAEKGRDGKVVFGFYKRKSHDIVPCESCLLQPEEFKKILKAVKFYFDENKISVYDEKSGKGLVRALYIRQGAVTKETGICLIINGDSFPKANLFAGFLSTQFKNIVSIVFNINKASTNTVLGKKYVTIFGKDGITDVLCGVKIDISPAAFYQVNHSAAELLYGFAAEFAGLSGKETVLDLYCGAGTIGLSMAKNAKKLIGVEIVPEAVENAKKNAKMNGIENAEFFCADAAKAAKMLEERGLRPDVIILDPPRKGCSEDTLAAVAAMSPERIVMVSCDTATMARDFKVLYELGYEPVKAQPVDMFPRTANIECASLLVKK